MLKVPVYNKAGEKIGEESIDPADFGGAINKQLLHDVVLMHLANRRVGTVNTRGRADVAGSGKKLFRQKGTGNARAGSKRTNKRKGGGVAFARRNRDYSYTMPKRAVRTAIRMAILSKFQDQEAAIVEGLDTTSAAPAPKTKEVAAVLRALIRPELQGESVTPAEGETKAQARKRSLHRRTVLIGTPALDTLLHRCARNIDGVQVAPVAEFNTYDVLKQKYLLLTPQAFAILKERAREKPRRRPAPVADKVHETQESNGS
jgi:large subunit ribosomal protein L4